MTMTKDKSRNSVQSICTEQRFSTWPPSLLAWTQEFRSWTRWSLPFSAFGQTKVFNILQKINMCLIFKKWLNITKQYFQIEIKSLANICSVCVERSCQTHSQNIVGKLSGLQDTLSLTKSHFCALQTAFILLFHLPVTNTFLFLIISINSKPSPVSPFPRHHMQQVLRSAKGLNTRLERLTHWVLAKERRGYSGSAKMQKLSCPSFRAMDWVLPLRSLAALKCIINVMQLNHPGTIPPLPTPGLWKNCLPQNWSLVPKSLANMELR